MLAECIVYIGFLLAWILVSLVFLTCLLILLYLFSIVIEIFSAILGLNNIEIKCYGFREKIKRVLSKNIDY